MKRRINKKRLLMLILGLIIILGIFILLIMKFCFTKIIFQNRRIASVNTTYRIKEYIASVKNGKITNLNEKIYFNELGVQKVTVHYKNRFGIKRKTILKINVVDDEAPVLEAPKRITIIEGDEDDLLKYVEFNDNYDTDLKVKIEGDYSKDKAGEYELYFVATDKSGNETKASFILEVNEKKPVVANQNTSAYFVRVNKTLNVAMVYGKDSNGEYTKLVKTFLVSTGENTPVGVWTTTDRYETLSLVGGVWGHYTIRIINAIWFHSVPYYSKADADGHWTDLEYEEFNKLGTSASLGCVRLSTIDAKWLYDNLPWHTQVEIYESNELPDGVVKPAGVKIDVNSEYRGWDPTDPDPANPWNL